MRTGDPALSKPFDAYAAYYDLLYAQKDYAGEAAYVDRIIRRYKPDAHSMLELGSGTGGHAIHFAQMGYAVHGIDLSQSMLSQAIARQVPDGVKAPTFQTADLRTFRTDQRFDAVVSLFHVMSYQISDDDLRAAMATAATHLVPGGVFVFDCWYGPGVLADPPSYRTRRLSGHDLSVIRTAHADHYPDKHRVNVRYEIEVRSDHGHERIDELHAMRYLFTEEIVAFLEMAELQLVESSAWMRDDFGDGCPWYACIAAVR